jgi:phytoene dehydrogenase-like protein
VVSNHVKGEWKQRREGPPEIDDLRSWAASEPASTGAAGNLMSMTGLNGSASYATWGTGRIVKRVSSLLTQVGASHMLRDQRGKSAPGVCP